MHRYCQPLLEWPSNGIHRSEDDRRAAAQDLIYFVREKHFGRPGRTLGPYTSLDGLKSGCQTILEARSVGLGPGIIRRYLKPLTLWQLVDFALAPMTIFREKSMPYDIITQPNGEVASALRSLPRGHSLALFAVRVTKTAPGFQQGVEYGDGLVPPLMVDGNVWGVATVHRDLGSANEAARRLLQHLYMVESGVAWADVTGQSSEHGLFAGVVLGKGNVMRAVVQVQAQTWT